MAKYKVLRNFRTELITGKRKFFERGSFFEVNTTRAVTIAEIKSRLRTGFIRELFEDEKPAKKVEILDKEKKTTKAVKKAIKKVKKAVKKGSKKK